MGSSTIGNTFNDFGAEVYFYGTLGSLTEEKFCSVFFSFHETFLPVVRLNTKWVLMITWKYLNLYKNICKSMIGSASDFEPLTFVPTTLLPHGISTNYL